MRVLELYGRVHHLTTDPLCSEVEAEPSIRVFEMPPRGDLLNVGDPLRGLEVKPLFYPAPLPQSPDEPNSASHPEPGPFEVPV